MPTCPHCGYEADPGSAECPLCGSRLGGGDVATAGPGAPSGPDAAGPVPWEDPSVPFFPGLWRTWRESVFEPTSFFRRVPRGEDFARPVLYLLIITIAAAFITLVWNAVLTTAADPVAARTDFGAGTITLLSFFAAPFTALVGLAVGTLFLHVFALLLAERPRSIGATARGLCYVTGPTLFGIVPVLGSLLGLVWVLVLEVIAMREIHRTTTGRAALIVFALPLLAIGLGLVLAVLVSLTLA